MAENRRMKIEKVKQLLGRDELSECISKLQWHFLAQIDLINEDVDKEAMDLYKTTIRMLKYSMDSGITKVDSQDYDDIKAGDTKPFIVIKETEDVTFAQLNKNVELAPKNITINLEGYEIVDAEMITKEYQEENK